MFEEICSVNLTNNPIVYVLTKPYRALMVGYRAIPRLRISISSEVFPMTACDLYPGTHPYVSDVTLHAACATPSEWLIRFILCWLASFVLVCRG